MMQKIIPLKIFAGWKGTVEMSSKHTQFYLDKQNAKWKGVCAGISDYTGVDVLWVRLGAVILTLAGGFPWTLVAYFGAAWFANKKPIHLYVDNDDQKSLARCKAIPCPHNARHPLTLPGNRQPPCRCRTLLCQQQ